jgi:hypothetical protein
MVNRKRVEEEPKHRRSKSWMAAVEKYLKRNLKECKMTRRMGGVFVLYNLKHYLIIFALPLYLVRFWDPWTGHMPVPATDLAQIRTAIITDPNPGYEPDGFWEDVD